MVLKLMVMTIKSQSKHENELSRLTVPVDLVGTGRDLFKYLLNKGLQPLVQIIRFHIKQGDS